MPAQASGTIGGTQKEEPLLPAEIGIGGNYEEPTHQGRPSFRDVHAGGQDPFDPDNCGYTTIASR